MTSLSCAVPPMLPPMAWDYCRVYWKAPFLDISVAPKKRDSGFHDVFRLPYFRYLDKRLNIW